MGIIEAFVAFDTSKLRNAVAIAEAGRAGEVRFLGAIENTEAAITKVVRKLAGKYGRLTFCFRRSNHCDSEKIQRRFRRHCSGFGNALTTTTRSRNHVHLL